MQLQASGTTLADVLEARSELEPPAAALLASRRTDRDLRDLDDCADGFDGLLDRGEDFLRDGAWAPPSRRFHDLILERSGNRTLAVQAGILREVVEMHMSVTAPASAFSTRPEELRPAARSYRRLISLVEERDTAGAERHWRRHMQLVTRWALREDLSTVTVLDLFG